LKFIALNGLLTIDDLECKGFPSVFRVIARELPNSGSPGGAKNDRKHLESRFATIWNRQP